MALKIKQTVPPPPIRVPVKFKDLPIKSLFIRAGCVGVKLGKKKMIWLDTLEIADFSNDTHVWPADGELIYWHRT